MPKVYITGLGFITSIGNDRETVLKHLRESRHGIVAYAPFAGPEVPVKVAAPVRDFDTESVDQEDWVIPQTYRIRREVLRGMGPNALYGYCAMQQAVADAGLTEADISNEDTGLYAASAGSPRILSFMLTRMNSQGVMRCSPLAIVGAISGTVNFNLVAHFKIKGASTGFASACASSAHAAGFAFDEIAMGRQSRMFVVGAEDGNADSILPFASMRALSLQPDPAKASRPFDVERDGFVGTGGATVLVLESEAEVQRRGVTPYCELLGWGQASDGHNVAISHPEGAGLAAAIRRALKATGVDPAAIEHVNAHATSTPIGDIAEAKALQAVFGAHLPRVKVSSTKALSGHGLSLAGAMETGFCALALRHQFVPGNPHTRQVDPACAFLTLPPAAVEQPVSYVLNNSSGFGGANVCLVMRKI
jgi:3-oxoacyl-[acyl-carrier-protein] synthase I